VGSLRVSDIVLAQQGSGIVNHWFFVPLFPMFVIFLISAMAETNRAPFDLPEAESELVAGYQTEYSSMAFALFWLGEYGNILLMCAMTSILFLGGWLPPFNVAPFTWIPGWIWFFAKIGFLFFVFAWVKMTVPRYRYDQLMRLGWKVFLPVSLGWLFLTAGVLVYFNLLPKH
jgi:NADH-quinone oxidoreductase subunit H